MADAAEVIEVRSEIRFERGDSYSGPGVLSGVILTYGDEAIITREGKRERFAARSVYLSPSISLNLQHDQERILIDSLGDSLRVNDTPEALRVRVELPATPLGRSAAIEVRAGSLLGFSAEFDALAEHEDHGVRIIDRAILQRLGLVDSPAYPRSTVEIRALSGRRLKALIPYDKPLSCGCIENKSCPPFVKFGKAAGDAMAAMLEGGEQDVLAVAGNYRRPLGSASRGTLRARSTTKGLEIEIDLPVGAVGEEVIAAHESAGVIVRPLIDMTKSSFTDTVRGREYTRPHVRAFLVGATDSKQGWPEVLIDKARAARAARRRLWL